MKRATLVLAVLFLASCADKFMAAKISVQAGRAATGIVQLGFDEADRANETECLKKDPQRGEVYKKCRQAMEVRLAWWQKSKATAEALWSAAEAGIKAAELKEGGKPIDYLELVRAGACLLAESLAYIPEKYRKKLQMYLDLMKGFGCRK